MDSSYKSFANNKPGKVSLASAMAIVLPCIVLYIFIGLEVIKYDTADLVSFLIPLIAPVLAFVPLTIGVVGFLNDENKIFSIIGMVISGIIILASMAFWINLVLFINSISGTGWSD